LPISGAQQTLDHYWRAVILSGRKITCYKFTLGQSLLELAPQGKEVVTLKELADPLCRYICEHLKIADKQTTPRSFQ